MRNMSFALTTKQMRERTKFVTRRMGWRFLKPGDKVQAVVKSQGLKKGEKVEAICVIEIVSVKREQLRALTDGDMSYGFAQIFLEGLALDYTPHSFVRMFCRVNKCEPSDRITRIEFKYV